MDSKHKLRIRTDAAILLVASVGIAIVLNALVLGVPARLDLTRNKVHTLSEASAEATRALDGVTVIAYISKKLPETIPTQYGKISVKGIDRAFRDKLEEYVAASDGHIRLVFADVDNPGQGTIEEQAEAAKLEMFSSTEAALEGNELKFSRYAMGATFHYKSVREVYPKALEPGFFEFEMTKRLLRLKEKYEQGQLMKDLLADGKKVFEAVDACNKKVQELGKVEGKKEGAPAGLSLAGQADPAQKRLKALKDNAKPMAEACAPAVNGLASAEASLKDRNQFVDNLLATAKQFRSVYEEMNKYLAGQGQAEGKVPTHMAVAQLLGLLDQLAGEVDKRHTTLTDSPGQKKIGFLCGHGEFCPFAEAEPLVDAQLGMMMQNNPMMKNIVDTAKQMATAIDQTNSRIGDGLFGKAGFSIAKVASGSAIPDNISALIIYAPRLVISEYDRFQIDQFLVSGRPVAILTQQWEVGLNNLQAPTEIGQDMLVNYSGMTRTTSNIGDILKAYGIELGADLVLDREHVDTIRMMEYQNRGGLTFQTQKDFPYALIPVASAFSQEHALTRSIHSLSIPFTTTVRASEALRNDKAFEVFDLIRTSDTSMVRAGTFNINPLSLRDEVLKLNANGPHTVAVLVRGPFKSAFVGKEIPKRPKVKKKSTPFPMPDEDKDETETDRELAKRRFKDKGAGQLLVVASNLGIEGLTRETVLPGFTATKVAKFSVEALKAYQEWQANFQNWQIRIGQVSHLLQDNLRFISNVMDWSTAHEALVDIRSKGDTRRPMREVKSNDARNMRLAAMLGTPLLLLLFGFARLQLRRRRSNQLQQG